ncbi:MAG: class I SAM-dependent methyltransferase [Solirubrobacterales bacterium]|nr:class I SAM-dependent methyltransferase [Solirubrobacterales bacterium]
MEEGDSQRDLIAPTFLRALKRAIPQRHELRIYLARDMWSSLKRFGSEQIQNVELGSIAGVEDAVINGYIDDRNRGVVAALCQALEARTFFEIGTNRGRTAWTVAHNNPDCEVYTLDLPGREAIADVELGLNASDRDFFVGEWDRGEAYQGTPEAARITTLAGDSANFDFSPYAGQMDVVFVDGAHSYEYVANDTRKALDLLSPTGTIIWDDYPAIPGVYRYLNETSFDRPLRHIYETRLVVYSRRELVADCGRGSRARLFAA